VLPPLPAAEDTVDVEVAAGALEEARAALQEGAADRALEAAGVAAALTGGQFLAGTEGTWVERRQAHLTDLHLDSLEALSEAATSSGQYRTAIEAAGEVVAAQPLRESAHRVLMAAHAAAGNRGEALRAYERCRRILVDELGVDPSPATEAVYLRLLGPEPPPAAAAGAGQPPTNLPAPPASSAGWRRWRPSPPAYPRPAF